MHTAVVLSEDESLYAALKAEFWQHRIEATLVSDIGRAVEILEGLRRSVLVVDLRDDPQFELVEVVFNWLGTGACRGCRLLLIGRSTIPRQWVGIASLRPVLAFPVPQTGQPVGIFAETSLEHWFDRRTALSAVSCTRIHGLSTEVFTYDDQFSRTLQDLQHIAKRDVTILIVGETGTGKTTLARVIHECSQRRHFGFQHLACGAIPTDLMESELFGHVRGAFTGADRSKPGRFEAAGKGTILLDEIDVLDVKQQAKLLKVIETGEYEQVGSTESRQSLARIITASNENLELLVEQGKFRQDLFYRLNVLEFHLPPLRQRPIDIIPLAMEFLDQFCQEFQLPIEEIDDDVLEMLRRYPWPGNLRELRNHIRRAALFCSGDRLCIEHFSPKLLDETGAGESLTATGLQSSLSDQVARNERELLMNALRQHDNNRTQTAKALGISRVGLYKKLRKHHLLESYPAERRTS